MTHEHEAEARQSGDSVRGNEGVAARTNGPASRRASESHRIPALSSVVLVCGDVDGGGRGWRMASRAGSVAIDAVRRRGHFTQARPVRKGPWWLDLDHGRSWMRRSSARASGRPHAGLRISRRVVGRCPHDHVGTDRGRGSVPFVGLSDGGNWEIGKMSPASHAERMLKWQHWIEQYLERRARGLSPASGRPRGVSVAVCVRMVALVPCGWSRPTRSCTVSCGERERRRRRSRCCGDASRPSRLSSVLSRPVGECDDGARSRGPDRRGAASTD